MACRDTLNSTDAQGSKTHVEWMAYYDGKDHPIGGDPNLDGVEMRKMGARAIDVISKKGGTPVRTTRWEILPDGKTLKRVQQGTTAQGQTFQNVLIHEKVE